MRGSPDIRETRMGNDARTDSQSAARAVQIIQRMVSGLLPNRLNDWLHRVPNGEKNAL
jgi:hypothetical protein